MIWRTAIDERANNKPNKDGRKFAEQHLPRMVIIVFLIFACVFLTMGIAVGWSLYRPYETTTLAEVTWKKNGTPLLVVVEVIGVHGQPLKDVEVGIKNNSGWQVAKTDDQGLAVLKMGELDVQVLKIGKLKVLERGGYPHLQKGLNFQVRLKVDVQFDP